MTSPHDPPPGDDHYGQPGQQQPSYQPPYPQPQAQSTPVLSIIGFVCAAIALLFIPILFGIIGIVLGIVGHTRGEALGKWAAIASAVTMVGGMILGIIVVNSMG